MCLKLSKPSIYWLKANVGNLLALIGTLMMSFAISPTPPGNGMMLDGIDGGTTPFALIKYGWMNQIGLMFIFIGFFSPYFWRFALWGKLLVILVVIPLFGWLILRFT